MRVGVCVAASLAALLLGCGGESPRPVVRAARKTPPPASVPPLPVKAVHEVLDVAPVPLEASGLGVSAGQGGVISGVQKEFDAGRPILLYMRFRESPGGLETTVRLLREKKLVFGDMHAMRGAKSVTFTIPGTVVRPGSYTVEGYWGGNLACQYPVTVKARR